MIEFKFFKFASYDDKSIKKKFVLFLFVLGCFLIPECLVHAAKVTIVYTGNSYSSLYPCGKCPASVGGGISRRSEAIKKIKGKKENVIIVDTGNFTAGGDLDSESINLELDKKRSLLNYQAMSRIGYDVIGLGKNEFIYGKEFLSENFKKYGLKGLSANIKVEGVLPYTIIEFDGLKIGFIGLSPKLNYKEYGIEVNTYEDAVLNVLDKLKNKADFIVLLSAIGEKDNIELAKHIPQLKVILSSGVSLNRKPYFKIGDTIIFNPAYQAKALGIINLELENNNLLSWSFEKEGLPLDAEEDIEMKKIIPECFNKNNCPRREGMTVKCQNPAEFSSSCEYSEIKIIEALVIMDENCPFCEIKVPKSKLKREFPSIRFRDIHYESEEAKLIIDQYSHDTLPLFVIDDEIKGEENYNEFNEFFDDRGDNLLLKKELSGIFYFLKREKISKRIDLFIDLYERGVVDIFRKINDFSKKNNIDLILHFVKNKDNVKGYLEEEIKVAIAVKEIYPLKFSEYLFSRIENIENSSWGKQLNSFGFDYKVLMDFIDSKKVDELIKENFKLSEEFNISQGNIIIINNKRIFKVFNIEDGVLENFFK